MTEMENADLLNDEEVKRWYVVNTYSGHENRVNTIFMTGICIYNIPALYFFIVQ